jgi:hypothetical protein
MSRGSCLALGAALLLGASCTRSPGTTAAAPVAQDDRREAFGQEPPFLFVVRPTTLERDPLYGPLVRRVSQLAASRAALADAVGSTMLAVVERTEEVEVAVYDREANDALVVFRGVPADADPARLMDTTGKPLWSHRGEIPGRVEELAPSDAAADGALFVLPRRTWVVAVGGAIPRARGDFAAPTHRAGDEVRFVPDEPPARGGIEESALAAARVRGEAIARRARPDGPLGPVLRALDVLTVTLEPGPQGSVGEVTLRLVYAEPAFAEKAAPSVGDVVAAYTRQFGARAPWLHAVTVSRDEASVVVRGRIPRAWADGFIHLDLGDLAD